MKRQIGDVWKDDFVSYAPWRVQAPKGVASFRTKKRAQAFASMWIGTLSPSAVLEMMESRLV